MGDIVKPYLLSEEQVLTIYTILYDLIDDLRTEMETVLSFTWEQKDIDEKVKSMREELRARINAIRPFETKQ